MVKVVMNPNKDFVKEFRNKIKENDGYCPCSIVKNEDTKCMCKEFRSQIKNNAIGECHCGLYSVIDE